MMYLKLIPYVIAALFAAWAVSNAFAVEEARSDLLEMTAKAQTNAEALQVVQASHEMAMNALKQRAEEQEKLAQSLEQSLKEVRNEPKTYGCGTSVNRALERLRKK